jgi:predicted DNA-binding transcriptional regulator YafY
MPATKDALKRYKILDQMLSDKSVQYTYDTLLNGLNQRLEEEGSLGISSRTLKYDLDFIETEFCNSVTLLRTPIAAHSSKSDSDKYTMKWIHYEDPHSSIFTVPMTEDEKYILTQSLSLLGHFEGIPNLKGLERLRSQIKELPQDENPIVVMESSCIENTQYFGELFSAITKQRPIELHHHTFQEPDVPIISIVHPYQLREYNNRWFLMGCVEENGKVAQVPWPFRLDSIDQVIILTQHPYRKYSGLLFEFFEEIIGVTNYQDKPCQTILFWVSDNSKGYVTTKSIHSSFKLIKSDEQYREKYPQLEGGIFCTIDCKVNYELIRELSSFGNDLVVLEPKDIQEMIINRAQSICDIYQRITQQQ